MLLQMYNSVLLKIYQRRRLYAKSINGDAFSNEIKQKTIDLIKKIL
jgi:enoyl-[acyl-carrier protein] reductase/trans-2-enoyl-CoA reductase (NAD+)